MSEISREIARLVRSDPRTQERIAELLGVSVNTFRMQVSSWGNGSGITSQKLEQVSDILGVRWVAVPLRPRSWSDIEDALRFMLQSSKSTKEG